MLYCPKCRRTYQEGTVRFCTNDGSRLLPAVNSNSGGKSGGVFSTLLNRNENSKHSFDEKLAEKPKFTRVEPPVFHSNNKNPLFKQNQETNNDLLDISIPKKNTGRLVLPNEIPTATAPVGDRQKFPTGRLAMTWENPNVLLGQTVKGRYYVEEKLGQDESTVTFLASDKILMGKKVVVKVLMENDDYLSKQFSDARVSLSHINHPNISNIFDSGELLEGKKFLISEYVEGETLAENLKKQEKINSLRTARIIRQVSYALGEAHQNGVLHRYLTPSRIILGVSDIGIEQVKVVDFGLVPKLDTKNIEKIQYFSPEEIEGREVSFASDIYSLAVIAYQMLTGRFPFSAKTTREYIDAQKRGLGVLPTNVLIDLPTEVDNIFLKALSFNPNERYSKTREFGDALFQALNQGTNPNVLSVSNSEETKTAEVSSIISGVSLNALNPKVEEKTDEYIHFSSKSKENLSDSLEFNKENKDVFSDNTPIKTESSDELLWEKRSTDNVTIMNLPKMIGLGLLIILLAGGLVWAWNYFLNNQEKLGVEKTIVKQTQDENPNSQNTNTQVESTQIVDDPYAIYPPAREIKQPEGYEYFGNNRSILPKKLMANYRDFSVYFPKTWQKCDWSTQCKPGNEFDNYVKLVKPNEKNPVELVVFGYYNSKGMFYDEDFSGIVKESEKRLTSEGLKSYQKISERKKLINNNRPVYELAFEGLLNGVKTFGKIFFVPPQRKGRQVGIRITMIASEASETIKSANDVGENGDMAEILRTFEPSDPNNISY
jgi:serine/threonine protein kinase